GYPANYFKWENDGSGIRGRYRFVVYLPEGSDRSRYWCAAAWPTTPDDQRILPALFIDQAGILYRSRQPMGVQPTPSNIYIGPAFSSSPNGAQWTAWTTEATKQSAF